MSRRELINGMTWDEFHEKGYRIVPVADLQEKAKQIRIEINVYNAAHLERIDIEREAMKALKKVVNRDR